MENGTEGESKEGIRKEVSRPFGSFNPTAALPRMDGDALLRRVELRGGQERRRGQ